MFSSKSSTTSRDRRQSLQTNPAPSSLNDLTQSRTQAQAQFRAPFPPNANSSRQSMDFNPSPSTSTTPASSVGSRAGHSAHQQQQAHLQGTPITRSMSSQTIGSDVNGSKGSKRKTFLGMHFGKDKGQEKETFPDPIRPTPSTNSSSISSATSSNNSNVNATGRQSFSGGSRVVPGGWDRQRVDSGGSVASIGAEGRVGNGGGGMGSPLAFNGNGNGNENGGTYMNGGQNGSIGRNGPGSIGMKGSQSVPFGLTSQGTDRRTSESINSNQRDRPFLNAGQPNNTSNPDLSDRLARPPMINDNDGLDPPRRSFGNSSPRPSSERSGSGTSGESSLVTPTGLGGPGGAGQTRGVDSGVPMPMTRQQSGQPQDRLASNTSQLGSTLPTNNPAPAPHRTPSSSHAHPSTFSTTSSSSLPKSASLLALEKVFEGLLRLIQDQGRKLYGGSPPEVELIVARATHGGQPKQGPPGSPSNDWDGVWMQLTGTSLSVWSMKETADADKRGERVPPTYYNITDSSLELLAPLPPPPHRPDSHPHPFVFSLNTAGSNRILFSCPTESNLTFWVTALRLASWEKSRIEEIYTGHVLRTYIKDGRPPTVTSGERPTWNEPQSPLRAGKMEGWVRVRVMGGVEWKRLWLVLTASEETIARERQVSSGKDSMDKKRRSIFGRADKDVPIKSEAGVASTGAKSELTSLASAVFYQGPPPKAGPRSKGSVQTLPPVLTITHVSQAYAVFPEHLEVITASNLLKVVGHISGEMVVVEGRQRLSGWAMIMPERSEEDAPGAKVVGPPIMDMLHWATGFHDAFGLYGRPTNYNWNRDDPDSLFFAYPHPPGKDRLFLDAGVAQELDYRIDVISQMRKLYGGIVQDRLQNQANVPSRSGETASPRADQPHRSLPDGAKMTPDASPGGPDSGMDFRQHLRTDSGASSFQLPPLDFNGRNELPLRSEALTPITERSDAASRKTSIGTMNTVNIRSIGGSQSSKAPGTGSGSSGVQLGRNPSFGTRLETALVAENLTTSPGLDAETYYTEGSAAKDYVGRQDSQPNSANPSGDATIQPGLQSRPESQASGYSQSGTDHTVPSPHVGSHPGIAHPQAFVPIKTSDDNGYRGSPLVSPIGSPVVRPIDLSPAGSSQGTSRGTFAPQTVQASPSVQSVIRFYGSSSDTGSGLSPDMNLSPQPQILSPTPQKTRGSFVSEDGLALQDDTVAMYLMSQAADGSVDGHRAPAARQDSLETPRPNHEVERKLSESSVLSRKPSGARAMPPKRSTGMTGSGSSAVPLLAPVIGDDDLVQSPGAETPVDTRGKGGSLPPSHTDDALAALSYLDKEPSPVKPQPIRAPDREQERESSSDGERFKSSFAPSKTAADRRARAEEAEKRQNNVLTRPGRAGGNANHRAAAGRNWEESSDEDDDDEDNDRNRSGSFAEGTTPSVKRVSPGPDRIPASQSQMSNATTQSSLGMGRPGSLRPLPEPTGDRRRTSRGLPPIPGQRSVTEAPPLALDHRDSQRNASWGGQQEYHQQSAPQPRPLPKPSPWTSALGEGHGDERNNDSAKFITLEQPSSMTKAFTPHGLLQAGMQDKEDRSARKQEEVAREAGASLVNVPNKPPPPQAGLLGAISGYERDRQNAGGIGAALTERERDKRLAEERQRQIGDLETLQRQQAMGQQQSMYGIDAYARPMSAFGGMGMMPGMMPMPSPMGYGNPMQNPMMWGNQLNPYAQQQAMAAAQMAYQTSLYMAMSNAGSQYGGDNNRNGGEGRTSPMPAMPSPYMPMGMGAGMMSPQGFMVPPFMGSPALSQHSGFPGLTGCQYMHQTPPTSAAYGVPSPNLQPMYTGNGQQGGGDGQGINRDTSPRPPVN